MRCLKRALGEFRESFNDTFAEKFFHTHKPSKLVYNKLINLIQTSLSGSQNKWIVDRYLIWKCICKMNEIIPSINNFPIFLHHFCDIEYDEKKKKLNLLKVRVSGQMETLPISDVLSSLV